MPSQRALGVKRNLESVFFGFRVKVKEKPPTRSGILSLVSSVYDPLGFASPFVLRTKGILQKPVLSRVEMGRGGPCRALEKLATVAS